MNQWNRVEDREPPKYTRLAVSDDNGNVATAIYDGRRYVSYGSLSIIKLWLELEPLPVESSAVTNQRNTKLTIEDLRSVVLESMDDDSNLNIADRTFKVVVSGVECDHNARHNARVLTVRFTENVYNK